MDYIIPAATKIGHVHLKVTDLQRSIDFYCGLLGFQITMKYGQSAVFIAAGGYHHHIGLNTWHSKDGPPANPRSPGLFHTAILFNTRKDLAIAVKRVIDVSYPLTGASHHGVSEAIYLDDPDGNGVELYYDLPTNEWPLTTTGELDMYTKPLNLQDLLAEISK